MSGAEWTDGGEFTPTDALEQTMEAVRRNYAAGETLGG